MEICTVDEYNAPADHRAIIANIRTSALAAGWTIEEYRASNEVWDSGVGWASGSHSQEYDVTTSTLGGPACLGSLGSFLQLQSNGFGNQGAQNRWRFYGFTVDNYRCYFKTGYGNESYSPNYGATNVISYGWPTQQSYVSDHADNPAVQNTKLYPVQVRSAYGQLLNNNSYYRHSTFPITACIKQWVVCYGTKFIHNIVNINNVFLDHAIFGVLDLFDSSLSDGIFHQKTITRGSYQYYGGCDGHWTNYITKADGLENPIILVNGVYSMVEAGTHLARLNTGVLRPFAGGPTNSVYGDYYDNIILQNTWSGKRVIHTPTVYTQLSGLVCPVGRMWYGVLNTENLTPGQILTYGNEQYQVWPVYSTTYPNTYGIAYRIA